MKTKYIFLICDLLLLTVAICVKTAADDKIDDREDVTEFQKLFNQKRIYQLDAVKNIMQLKEEKQEKVLNTITDKLFEVLTKNRVMLESSEFVPGLEMPKDEKIKDSLALVIENVCLANDLLLRFPDYIHARLDKKNDWKIVYKWSISFVSETNLIVDSSSKQLFHLASQEIGLVPKDENYVNPYRQEKKKHKRYEDPPEPKKKKRKKLQKGPRMSQDEL